MVGSLVGSRVDPRSSGRPGVRARQCHGLLVRPAKLLLESAQFRMDLERDRRWTLLGCCRTRSITPRTGRCTTTSTRRIQRGCADSKQVPRRSAPGSGHAASGPYLDRGELMRRHRAQSRSRPVRSGWVRAHPVRSDRDRRHRSRPRWRASGSKVRRRLAGRGPPRRPATEVRVTDARRRSATSVSRRLGAPIVMCRVNQKPRIRRSPVVATASRRATCAIPIPDAIPALAQVGLAQSPSVTQEMARMVACGLSARVSGRSVRDVGRGPAQSQHLDSIGRRERPSLGLSARRGTDVARTRTDRLLRASGSLGTDLAKRSRGVRGREQNRWSIGRYGPILTVPWLRRPPARRGSASRRSARAVLAGGASLVRVELRGSDRRAGARLGGDRRRTAHAHPRPDGEWQDAGRLPVVPRSAGARSQPARRPGRNRATSASCTSRRSRP